MEAKDKAKPENQGKSRQRSKKCEPETRYDVHQAKEKTHMARADTCQKKRTAKKRNTYENKGKIFNPVQFFYVIWTILFSVLDSGCVVVLVVEKGFSANSTGKIIRHQELSHKVCYYGLCQQLS